MSDEKDWAEEDKSTLRRLDEPRLWARCPECRGKGYVVDAWVGRPGHSDCEFCGDSRYIGLVRVSSDDLKERAIRKLGPAAGNDFYVDPYLIRLVVDAALGETI